MSLIDAEIKRQILLFLFKYFICILIIFAILYSNFEFKLLVEATIFLTSLFLNLANVGFMVNGSTIIANTLQISIARECCGWLSIALFSSLAIATAKNLKTLLYIPIFWPILFFTNSLRIFLIIFLSTYIDFEILHLFFWKIGTISEVIIFYFLWLYFSKNL